MRSDSIKLISSDLQAFAIHGVTPEFIDGMNAAGFGKLSSDNLLAAKIHNVTPQYIKQWKDRGYELDADNIVNKKVRGNN